MRRQTVVYVIWILQLSILALAVVGLATGNATWVPAGVVSFVITLLPAILERRVNVVLPLWLVLWIVVSLFLHATGGYFGFYDSVPYWDHITHAISSSLVAALGFIVVVTIDVFVESIRLPRPFLAVFVFVFAVALGVFWEIMEYAQDWLIGTRLQYNLDDTMIDLFFDAMAGLTVAIGVFVYIMFYKSPEEFVGSMGIIDASQKLGPLLRFGKKTH